MSGAEFLGDLAVVLGALVRVFDHERDRRASRHLPTRVVIEDARQDLHRIRLAPLGGVPRLPRSAAIEVDLNVLGLESNTGRAAVDHAAERRPVALAPGRDAEKMTESVVRHRLSGICGTAATIPIAQLSYWRLCSRLTSVHVID